MFLSVGAPSKVEAALGGAVEVDPMKPMLKAPGTKHLKP
jgi:hypothetical protein